MNEKRPRWRDDDGFVHQAYVLRRRAPTFVPVEEYDEFSRWSECKDSFRGQGRDTANDVTCLECLAGR